MKQAIEKVSRLKVAEKVSIIKALFFLLLFISLLWGQSCQSHNSYAYTVRSGHPRIFITPDNKAMLQARCVGSHLTEYTTLENYARKNMGYNYPGGDARQLTEYARLYAFLYQMGELQGYAYDTGKTPLDYGNEAVRLFKVTVDTLADQNFSSSPKVIAAAYDWVWDLIPEDYKIKAAQKWINYHKEEGKCWNDKTDFGDWALQYTHPVVFVGMALYGDHLTITPPSGSISTDSDHYAGNYVDVYNKRIIPRMFKAYNLQAGDHGGDAEGSFYAPIFFLYYIDELELLRTAGSQDLYPLSYRARGMPKWLTYIYLPFSLPRVVNWGDLDMARVQGNVGNFYIRQALLATGQNYKRLVTFKSWVKG